MAKKRRQPRWPDYYRDLERHVSEDDNPALIAVRQRVPQEAAQKRLVHLQGKVQDQLSGRKPFLDLEALRNNLAFEWEVAFFNVGHELGVVVGAARASPAKRSKKAKKLAEGVLSAAQEVPSEGGA